MSLYVVDTETTGFLKHPIHGHPQVIELAYIPVVSSIAETTDFIKETSLPNVVKQLSESGKVFRYMPTMDIHKNAVDIHGITMRDLLGKPKSETLKLPSMEYMIGHNIQYDYRCLGKPEGIKLVCTMGLAKKLDKKFGIGFKNAKQDDLLRHFYGEDLNFLLEGHHAALEDCTKNILLLVKLAELVPGIKTFEELYIFLETLKKV